MVWPFEFMVPRIPCDWTGEATYIRRGVSHGRHKLNAMKSDVVRKADEIGQDLAQLFITVRTVVFEEYTS